MYSRVRPTRMWRTLQYALPGYGVLYSMFYPGRTYSRVRGDCSLHGR